MKGIYEFYKDQVVFLTGSTGGLGGCLLYKLGVVLAVPRLYVLIRGSESRALERWKHTMPHQLHQIQDRIRAGRIILVSGDMTQEGFGISEEILQKFKDEVTLIIHTAANISLQASLSKVVADNCLASLRLAALATKLTKLQHFTQVSSAYANSFLPDGPVEEKVYYLANPDDAEGELQEILQTGTTKYLKRFAWPYAYSKQLMERLITLITARFPNLSLLLLPPTGIGPAIAQPYVMYGPKGSCPISTLMARLMMPTGGVNIWRTSKGAADGSNILDEIPVDILANVLLQHVHLGTRGVVHGCSAYYYIPKTLKWMLGQPSKYVPIDWAGKMATPLFVQDRTIKQSGEAEFYQMGSRDWKFCAPSLESLEPLQGPLTPDMDGHDIDRFTERRVKVIFQDVLRQYMGLINQRARVRGFAKL
jgi:alcohol-forming fatty acyl-CoA reductase